MRKNKSSSLEYPFGVLSYSELVSVCAVFGVFTRLYRRLFGPRTGKNIFDPFPNQEEM